MSLVYVQNLKTANNSEPLTLTTGANYPRVTVNSVSSTVNIESANVLLSGKSIVETIWIPASAMIAINRNTVNAFQQIETGTNKLQYYIWSFDPSIANGGTSFTIRMNNKWDRGLINCSILLSQKTTSTGNAVYNIRATSFDNGDSSDLTQGNMCNVTLTMGTANTVYFSNINNYQNGAILVGDLNTSVESPTIYFEIIRDISSALDNLAVETCLHGIELKYSLKEEL